MCRGPSQQADLSATEGWINLVYADIECLGVELWRLCDSAASLETLAVAQSKTLPSVSSAGYSALSISFISRVNSSIFSVEGVVRDEFPRLSKVEVSALGVGEG